jgi:RND superfamily putative drug exporter
VPFSNTNSVSESGFWTWVANNVMKRPFAVLIPSVIVLMLAGSPFLGAEWGITTWKALSPDDEARNGMEITDERWPEDIANTVQIVFETIDSTDPFSEENIRNLHAFSNEINQIEKTNYVYNYAYFDTNFSLEDVISFWDETNDNLLSEDEKIMLDLQREFHRTSSIGNNGVIVVHVGIDGDQASESSRNVVKEIRNLDSKSSQFGGTAVVNVAGLAAYNQDVLDAVVENMPIAIGFILISSYILIFLQVRSIILPFKALIMNILSVTASFGVLVWIFQEGNGSELLNFTPQPIDPTTPVMIFAILFGLSMDYEVLMLSRIHEEWERTEDNTQAVAVGLQKSGRIITSAALVMITVFSAFGLSSVALMKQFGFMLALGVAVDATIVRALVVPSTMRLMGNLNWWAPSWLQNDSKKP